MVLLAVVVGTWIVPGQDAAKGVALTPADADLLARIEAVKAADHAGKDVVRVLDRTDVEVAESGLSTMTFRRVERQPEVAQPEEEEEAGTDAGPEPAPGDGRRIR